MQALSTEQESVVKIKKELIAVPKDTNVQITCRIAAWPFKEDIIMFFQPDLSPQWPDGLEFYDHWL